MDRGIQNIISNSDRFWSVFDEAPEATAFVDCTQESGQRLYTFSEIAGHASRLVTLLDQLGAGKGDRIAALLPNGIDLAILYLAGLRGGQIIVPLDTELPQEQAAHALRLAEPKLIVAATGVDIPPAAASISRFEVDGMGALIEAAMGCAAKPLRGEDGNPFLMVFTSGATGQPKGVCHSAGSLIRNAMAFNRLTGYQVEQRMLHVMPMTYMAGILNTLIAPLAAGGSVVLALRFTTLSAMRFWRPVMEHNVTAMWLSPTMASILCQLDRSAKVREWTRANLMGIFVGTAPLTAAAKDDFESRFGAPIYQSYGMSEILYVSANSALFPMVPGGAGHVIDGVAVETRDEQGNSLPLGCEGELWFLSPDALIGYLYSPEEGLTSPLVEGWLASGDIGRLDPDGSLFITGRRKDQIIRGGFNVNPAAIERVLRQHSAVMDVAAVGIVNRLLGEEIVAVLQLADQKIKDIRRDLDALCRNALPPFSLPDRYVQVVDFPRSPTGKILKARVRSALALESDLVPSAIENTSGVLEQE